MFRKAQTNSCVCGQTFAESHAYLKHTRTCQTANARSEKASAAGVAKLARRLELKEKRKKDRADTISGATSAEVETVPFLERLKRKLSVGKEHQGGLQKRGRMSSQDSVSIDTPTCKYESHFRLVLALSDVPIAFPATAPSPSSDIDFIQDRPATPPPRSPPPIPRRRFPSRRFKDFLPEGVSRLLSQYRDATSPNSPPPSPSAPLPDAHTRLPRVRLLMPKWKTAVNRFGVFREYRAAPGPSYIPDENPDLNSFVLQPPQSRQGPETRTEAEINEALQTAVYPFPNLSSFWFRKHHSDHPNNSKAAMAKMKDLILHPRFFSKDLEDFDFDKVDQMIADGKKGPPSVSTQPRAKTGGWTEATVSIDIPSSSKDSPSPSTVFNIDGFHYRPLVNAIRTSLANPSTMAQVHLEPYKSFWQRPGSSALLRIYDELYTSDAMLKAHEDLQRQPREPGCNLERVVLSLLFASDATHPTNFGQAKVWPLYMAFGNISKYERCKPTSGLMEHVAYFPSVCLPVAPPFPPLF